jgi:hypothetical protein
MKTLFLAVLTAYCAAAQITSVRVLGTTATQAVVAYTAPDATACTLSASQTADGSGDPTPPLIQDLDPSVFAGSNLDSRAGNISAGLARTFVIGKRDAEIAASGYYVSRALKANAFYYGKITCGAASALFTFQTTNIPLGLGASDPWPTDASHPGRLAIPSSLGAIGESFTDPLTGANVVRVTYPGFGWGQSSNQSFSTAYDQGQPPCDSSGPWTNPCNAIANTAPATVSNSTAWLVLRSNSGLGIYGGTDPTYGKTLTQFQLSASASASVPGQSLDACLSMNAGASCASPIENAALPGSMGTITVGENNTSAVGYDSWIVQSWPRISRWVANTLQGTLTVSGTTATWASTTSGGSTFFSNDWAGGRILLSSTNNACSSGTDYTIVSGGGNTLTLGSAPGDGTYYYCAPNFAVMIREHDAGVGGTVSVQNAKWTATNGDSGENSGSGQTNICASAQVAGGVACFWPSGGSNGYLGWTDPNSGATSLVGDLWTPAKSSGANTWTASVCPATGPATFSTIDDVLTSVLTWYCVKTDGAGYPIILQMQYTGSLAAQSFQGNTAILTGCSSTDDYTLTCSNGSVVDLTPSSLGKDLRSQMNTFSGQTVDPAMGFHTGPVQQGKFFVYAYYGQNTAAWFAVFDPGDRNPAHAGLAGGPSVIATASSFNGGPGAANRWGEVHSVNDYGCCSGYFGWSNSVIGEGSNSLGATAIGVTATGDLGTGVTCPTGYSGTCVELQITANGGSYEPYYLYNVGSQGQTPGVPNTAGVGDLACVSSVSGCCHPVYGGSPCSGEAEADEVLELVQKNASGQWIFLRNALQNGCTAPNTGCHNYHNYSGTLYLNMLSGALTTQIEWPGYPNSNGVLGGNVLWNYAADPYGLSTAKDPEFLDNHASTRPAVVIEQANSPISPYPSVYRARHADNLPDLWNAPINVLASNPSFAGTAGSAAANVWQSHPSAGPNAASTAYDFRPLEGFYTTAPGGADLYANVTGQLWKATYTATTPDVLTGGQIKLNRKIFATAASSGMHPLVDVSGPSSSIDGTAADRYEYCIVRVAGECYPGSSAGQIYVNAPGVVYPFCQGDNVSGQTKPAANDICVIDKPPLGEGLVEVGTTRGDPNSLYQRTLVSAMSGVVKGAIGIGGLMSLPSGWIAFNANYLDGLSRADYIVQIPPFPAVGSMNRNVFIPVTVSLMPTAALGVNNAVVEFGYQEYNGNCTTRNDTCVANTATIGSTPFVFASENPAGIACASGCSIAIPAISQRVLYYRVKYRNAANNILRTTPFQVMVTP